MHRTLSPQLEENGLPPSSENSPYSPNLSLFPASSPSFLLSRCEEEARPGILMKIVMQ